MQPSLFEGWSTVIEDVKAINQFIIAANIAIHKELLKNYPNYVLFEKQKPEALTSTLKHLRQHSQIKHYDYKKNISEFGSLFLSIVKS